MSLSSFLKGATRVRFDSHTLGNLVRNGGLAAGTLIGGPLGAGIAGGVSALRTAARPGANIGDALRSGVEDASTAYGLHAAGSSLAKLAGGGAPPVPTGAPGPLSSASSALPTPPVSAPIAGASDAAGSASSALPVASDATAFTPPPAFHAPSFGPQNATAALQGAPPGGAGLTGALTKVPTSSPGLLSRIGGFVEHNPTASMLGLQGLSGALTSGPKNRQTDAETRLLEQQAQASDEAKQRRAAQDAFFRNGTLSLAPMTPRPNPYGGG